MQIRLTQDDTLRVAIVQDYFARLVPAPVHLGQSDVMRVALRKLVEELGKVDEKVAQAVGQLENAEPA